MTTRTPPTLTPEEYQALWEWHRRMELEKAHAAQYDLAKWHKERHEMLARFIAPQDEWERAWPGEITLTVPMGAITLGYDADGHLVMIETPGDALHPDLVTARDYPAEGNL